MSSRFGGDGMLAWVPTDLTGKLVFCVVAALWGPLVFGYNLAVVNSLENSIVADMGEEVKDAWSLAASIVCLGAFFGALSAGLFADRFGRRKTIAGYAIATIVTGLILFWARPYGVFVFARFLIGICAGAASVYAPLYISEIAPMELRGMLGASMQLTVTFGIVLAGFFDRALNTKDDWRWLMFINAIIGVITLVMWLWIPESPKYLAKRGDITEATDVLRLLRPEGADITEEIDALKVVSAEASNKVSSSRTMEIFRQPLLFQMLKIGALLMIVQQFSGINAIFNYSNKMFLEVGMEDPFPGIVLVNLANFFATAVAVWLTNKYGRIPLLRVSQMGMAISSVFLTMCYALKGDGDFWKYSSIIFMVIYVIMFELALGPLPWFIIGEMCPTSYRGPLMSICAGINWFSAFIVVLTFPGLESLLTDFVFLPYGVVCLWGFVYVSFWVPETKGKTVEEVMAEMRAKLGEEQAATLLSQTHAGDKGITYATIGSVEDPTVTKPMNPGLSEENDDAL